MNKTSKLACFFLQSLFREDKVLLFAFPGLTTFLILTNLPVYSEPPRATTFGRLTTVAGTLYIWNFTKARIFTNVQILLWKRVLILYFVKVSNTSNARSQDLQQRNTLRQGPSAGLENKMST